MATDVIDAKPNNDATVPNADIKAPSLMAEKVVPPPETKPTEADAAKAAADKVAADKAEADKGKTPEQIKAEADKAAADKLEADKKAAGAPEKYEDFKVKENVTLDTEVTTKFQTLAKESGLPQEAAQKLVDLAVEHVEKLQTNQAAALEAAGVEWHKNLTNDKEFGGIKFKANQEVMIRFRDKFSTPEERKEMEPLFNTAWGNFPPLWKMLTRAGLAIGEDKIVEGGLPTPAPESASKALFPTMFKK